MTTPGRFAAPYAAARDSATPTPDPRHAYRGRHRGQPAKHDSDDDRTWRTFCHVCDYRGKHKRREEVAA